MKQMLILLCSCFFGCDSILGVLDQAEGCCVAYDYSSNALFTNDEAHCQDDWTKDNCDSILGPDYDYHMFYEDESCNVADNRSSFECWDY